MLEAQACGLPVVVSDAGGPRENMEHGATGYVCRSGDAGDFCRRLAGLLRDAGRRADMGRAARWFAEDRTWLAALNPLYAVYRSAAMPALAGRTDAALPAATRAASQA